MLRALALISLVFLLASPAFAGQSVIVEVDGMAAMGDDKSRKETMAEAKLDAKRNAAENAVTYVKSDSTMEDFTLSQDLVEAYARAMVEILEVMDTAWERDPGMGEVYRIHIRAEVVPDTKALENKAKEKKTDLSADPAAPLSVRVWADKETWAEGETMSLYLTGNKPFYARVVYEDASGNLVQILPNPYRRANYFQGGAVYRLPSGEDYYELAVSPPFGKETVHVYASTEPLGEVDAEAAGPVYLVKDNKADLGAKTRGIKIVKKADTPKKTGAAQFFETQVSVTTTGKPEASE